MILFGGEQGFQKNYGWRTDRRFTDQSGFRPVFRCHDAVPAVFKGQQLSSVFAAQQVCAARK